jgi:hypothetical protein
MEIDQVERRGREECQRVLRQKDAVQKELEFTVKEFQRYKKEASEKIQSFAQLF